MKIYLKVLDFDTKLWFSFEESYSQVLPFLIGLGVPERIVRKYYEAGEKRHVNARTTYFSENDIVLVKMNYYDNSIRSVSILMHETIHAALRIIEAYEIKNKAQLENKEEALCYTAEYIFEEIMKRLNPEIDYTERKRDMAWFMEVTHKLKNHIAGNNVI